MTNRKKRIWIVIGSFLLVLFALRLALPYIVLRYTNKVLADMNGYYGHVEDIDIHLLRGAYTIKELRIDRKEKKTRIPFFYSEAIDLSVQWKALFKGSVVGEVEAYKPQLNFAASAPNGEDNDWRKPVEQLFPLKINRLAVKDGEIHYRDFTTQPHVDMFMRDISAEITNLTNSDKLSKSMVAHLHATGKVMKNGSFYLKMEIDPYADDATFDMDAKMEKVSAPEFNDFFKAYGKFEVADGTIGLYTEAAASKGKINGYVKPIIENLKVLNPKKEKLGPIKFVYQAVVAGVAEIFKNHPKDRIATRVEFSGDIKNPKMHIWTAVVNVLKNAFIHVLIPGIDNSISLQDSNEGIVNEDKSDKKEEKKKKKEEKKREKEKK